MSEHYAIPNSLLPESNTFVNLYEVDSLNVGISNFEIYLSNEPEVIAARQRIYNDILMNPKLIELLEKLEEKVINVAELQKKTGTEYDTETLLYAILDMRLFCDTISFVKSELSPFVEQRQITSPELIRFVDACCEFERGEQYREAFNWLNRLNDNLNLIKSVTLGANLDSQLKIREIGIVSINMQPYVSKKFMDSIFRDENVPDEYKCIASLGIHETKSMLGHKSVSVNNELFSAMNTCYRSLFKHMRKDLFDSFKDQIIAVSGILDDLDFIIRSSKYLRMISAAGGKLTFPEIADTTEIRGLYLPQLLSRLRREQIVENDVKINDDNRCFLLTGPNNGGKSVYLNSIGIAQLMFQLGLPIPAEAGKMQIFDTIATLYVHDTKHINEGRLADEVQRLKACLDCLKGRSLLLLDETFSGTSAFDGVFLAESLVKYLYKNGICMYYITHFHELTQKIAELNADGSNIIMLTAENADGRRTYKMVPWSGSVTETSLAKDIVIDHGLGFLFE